MDDFIGILAAKLNLFTMFSLILMAKTMVQNGRTHLNRIPWIIPI